MHRLKTVTYLDVSAVAGHHAMPAALLSPMGFVCVRDGPRYKWWQRWDDVNCRTGVALPMGFPGQISGRNFSEGKVMLRLCNVNMQISLPVHIVWRTW